MINTKDELTIVERKLSGKCASCGEELTQHNENCIREIFAADTSLILVIALRDFLINCEDGITPTNSSYFIKDLVYTDADVSTLIDFLRNHGAIDMKTVNTTGVNVPWR